MRQCFPCRPRRATVGMGIICDQLLGYMTVLTIELPFLCGPCRGARHQDLLIDWPSVAMWHGLWLNRERTSCGGGLEYFHRSPSSRSRRRKGSLEFETVNYGHNSYGTRTREWFIWGGPAAILNNRPVLQSERALHIKKPASVWQ
jgi:hypothetical protein